MYHVVEGTGRVIASDNQDTFTQIAVGVRDVRKYDGKVTVQPYVMVVHVYGPDHPYIGTVVEPGNLVWFKGAFITNGHGRPIVHQEGQDGEPEAYFRLRGNIKKLADAAEEEREDGFTVVAVGRLGKDPEMRYLPSGTGFTNFSFASERSYLKDGQFENDTTWFQLAAWDKKADKFNEMTKGTALLIEINLKATDQGHPEIWHSDQYGWSSSHAGSVRTYRFMEKRGESSRNAAPHAGPNGEGILKPGEEIPFV